jgi:hypothetical protein
MFLEAVWAPKKVAVMHCLQHQKGTTPVALGNWRADQEAQAAAIRAPPTQPIAVTTALIPTPLTVVFHITPAMNVSGSFKRKESITKGDSIRLQIGK